MEKWFSTTRNRFSPLLLLLLVSVSISFLTRIVILISFGKTIDATPLSLAGSFFIGLLYDCIVAFLLIIPFLLQVTFTNNFIYSAKGKWVTILFFTAVLFILCFTSLVPSDFNASLYKVLIIYIGLRFAIFLFLLTRSRDFRTRWRSSVLQVFFFLTVFVLFFNAVSEWFFWNEFSSRYNFIAVDYLVYTNEVIGNIQESYPIIAIVAVVLLATVLVFLRLRKTIRNSVQLPMRFVVRLVIAVVFIGGSFLLAMYIPAQWKYFSKNNYTNELAGNGIYDFVQAFKKNELDFFTYYTALPDSTAFKILKQRLNQPGTHFSSDSVSDIRRQIIDSVPEKKMNVVLISVESLSASYMESFGNTGNLTPQLDSLAKQGMLFTKLYASGTRTVRGLEALSLSIPPLPGQSIVKRPGNEGLFSLGSVFKSKGYISQYIYGGYGYFDNMNYFFRNNDYEVIDRSALKTAETHYANIWGVADEDLFTLALRTMDDNDKTGKPFFAQVMTVSNHRPYTYPDGRIDIPPTTQSREGAVKYTDYAIGDFIKRASQKKWFANTIFVIVADHCASSAGKQELPPSGYHIPMIIYSPGYIQPQQVNSLMAQIDIAPTILGLLHFSYTTLFFGNDIFKTPVPDQRAFISTYQGLGFLKADTLIVQSPVRKLKAYKVDPSTGDMQEVIASKSLVEEAIAYYQTAARVIGQGSYRKLSN